uniref:Uncharacterized protein n=1 Tax=Romanomermis culicivorax TaxID=13658 RepID=A0A915L9R6_ROMCU
MDIIAEFTGDALTNWPCKQQYIFLKQNMPMISSTSQALLKCSTRMETGNAMTKTPQMQATPATIFPEIDFVVRSP